MPSSKPEIHNRKHYHSSKHQDVPVHGNRIRVRDRREKAHNERQCQERDAEDVEWKTDTTKREARGEKGFSANAFDDDAGNRDDVGGEEGADAKGSDDVEGDSAANVDEGE